MANQLEQVNKEIIKIDSSIDGLVSKLKGINDQMINISKNAREVSSSIGNVTSPKGLDESMNKSAKSTDLLIQLTKEREATERKLISTIAKKALIQDDATKKLVKENEELKILRREQRNQLKAVSEIAGAYTKLSSQTNILIKRYQDLAVRQAKGEELTAKETRRLEKLGQVIEKNQGILKKTDAEVGRFQRNVGNYASGFDGLGNAINQLTREAPAFANSLQTGFLAISNNLPILFDQLKAITDQNKILREEGKPTESVFKRLGSAIFSFQTFLSLGVTLLTLYGKQLVELIQKSIDGGAKVRDLAKNQKILNEAYKEAAKSAASEISQLQLLLAVASDKTKSDQTRKKAVDKLIDSSGGLIKEQDRLNILNGKAVELENKLVKAILNRAIVQQLQSKISEDINKLLDTQIKLSEVQAQRNITVSKTDDAIIKALRNGIDVRQQEITIKEKGIEVTRRATEEEIKQAVAVREALRLSEKGSFNTRRSNQLDERSNELKKESDVIQGNINNLIKEALKLTDDYTLSLDNNTKSITKRNKALAQDLKTVEDSAKDTKKLSDLFGKLFKDFDTKSVKDAKEDLDALDFESVERYADALKNAKSFELPEIDTEAVDNKIKELTESIREELKKAFEKELLEEAFNDLADTVTKFLGFDGRRILDFFRDLEEFGVNSFNELADVAQESYDIIGDVANSFFQRNIERYEADIEANNLYYENLLANQTLTDSERERLEADRAAKEEEIRKKQRREQIKQAQFERAIQIAQIITNTAKAVVQSLPNIPLAIAVGAIGAAQLGIALATPIPQFKDGHLSGTHEGLAIINDASGGNYQEVVQRKDGTLEMYKDRNQLINMQRGDKVFKAGTHGAEDYLKGISDKELMKDVNKHSFIASLQHQNYMIAKLENTKSMNNDKLNTDRIVKAINSKKTKFNLNQSINIGEDLSFLKRLDF